MDNKGCALMGQYELGRLLGIGSFAKVHYARNLKTGMSVAIKIIDKEKILKVGLMEHIKREISVMRLVKHPNVVELYEVLATKTKIYCVMEYVKGGELLNQLAKGRLKEDVARNYFQQLITAIDFCHNRGVYHRDLKPQNLLLDEYGNLKVADFGLSALSESRQRDGLLHTTCGTANYVAPEVLIGKGYDGSKADIWSCGVILYVLLACYPPFHDPNIAEVHRKIISAKFKSPKWFSPDVYSLISEILDPNMKTRISISKIMENSWFCKGFKPNGVGDGEGGQGEGKLVIPDGIFSVCENNDVELGKPTSLNAFDIISLSAGFDLSALFEEEDEKGEFRFTSRQPAKCIMSKIEETAKMLKMKVMKKEKGILNIEGLSDGRKGALAVDALIFEITPEFHLIEVKKSNGDTLEYQKMMKQEIRPALKDIVWTWQGDQTTAQQQQTDFIC